MEIIERKGDLFLCDDADAFMQCVSSDFACGAGIAIQFNQRFNTKTDLLKIINGVNYWDNVSKGYALITQTNNETIPVINLITKRNYYQKPTLQTLQTALYGARILCESRNIKRIAMPHIGAGLDKLNFYCQVMPTLKSVFEGLNITIIIYEK